MHLFCPTTLIQPTDDPPPCQYQASQAMSEAKSRLWYHKTNGFVKYQKLRPNNSYRMLALRIDEKTSDTLPSSTKLVDDVKKQYTSIKSNRDKRSATDQDLAWADFGAALTEIGNMLYEHGDGFIKDMMGTEWDHDELESDEDNYSGDGMPSASLLETQTLSRPPSSEEQRELKPADTPAKGSSDEVWHAHSDGGPCDKVSTTRATQGTHWSDREIVRLVQGYRLCKIETNIWKAIRELYMLTRQPELDRLAQPLECSLETEANFKLEQERKTVERTDWLDRTLSSYQHMLAQVEGATQNLALSASLEELKQMMAYEDDDDFETALRQLSLEKDVRSEWSPSRRLSEGLSTDQNDRAASDAGSPALSEKEGMDSSVPVHSAEDRPANENEQYYAQGMGRRSNTFGGKRLNWPWLEDMITEKVSRWHPTTVKGLGTRGDRAVPSNLRDWLRSELPDE